MSTEKTFEELHQEATLQRQRFPDRVPVIMSKSNKCTLSELEKKRFLISNDMELKGFVENIKRRLDSFPDDGKLYLLANDELLDDNMKMIDIYEKYKSKDDFLRMTYTSENPKTKQEELNIMKENLKAISELEEYQKLWADGNTLSKDSCWIPSVTRWMYGQSREIIVPNIVKTIKNALELYKYDESVIELTKLAVKGLRNLSVTYPTKKEELDELINMIEKH